MKTGGIFLLLSSIKSFNPFLDVYSPGLTSGSGTNSGTTVDPVITSSTMTLSSTTTAVFSDTTSIVATTWESVVTGTATSPIMTATATTTSSSTKSTSTTINYGFWPPLNSQPTPEPSQISSDSMQSIFPFTPTQSFEDSLMWISFFLTLVTLVPITIKLRVYSLNKHLLTTLAFQLLFIVVQFLGIIGVYTDRSSPAVSSTHLLKACFIMTVLLSLWFKVYIISMLKLLLPSPNFSKSALPLQILSFLVFIATTIPFFTFIQDMVTFSIN